ncbi:MAG: cytochrome c oxidase subunit I [Thermoanaerobaculia bacterium]|jgi:cytochrome c oxidase subunit 1|nr:cytochrome c oxidase subunit I [Thermoanaerobaculia bacterium]MBP9824891.1 cytochrome c oxidase subunit I [Thermoanaerobaculia bacterium]
MNAIASAPAERPNFLTNGHGLKSWLLTLDHKRVAMLYLISVSCFFLLGGIFAMLIRLELMTPLGDLMLPDTYNRVFTGHGVTMVFFFLIPAIPGILGNFLIPLMIGAKDVAFPRLNLASWYLYMTGGVLMLIGTLNGGVDTGWTFYPPYSTSYTTTNVLIVGIGVFINGFSSILTGLNFMVTVHRMRCPGMTWFRLPLFIWGQYATSLIMVLGTPVVAITLLLLVFERLFHLGIFDPAKGGDPILFQHLFWFYSHPAVYIMILPSMAVISELIACFSRKRIFGYHFVAFASIGIAVLGFIVWGHHLYVSGQSVYAGAIFSLLTMLVAIPSAVKVFNWSMTLYQGSVSLETPMLYALGFIGLFTIGGLTGVFLGTLGFDVHVHDTYFVVAHFHYVMVGGTIMGYLGGLHFWWPKITGRMYPEFWAKISALLVFVGFNLTFFPQFLLGYMGMPRRYHAYPEEFQVLNILSTAGASVLAIGFVLPTIYFIWSLTSGPLAGNNPWQARGLEWETTSPPPTENFTSTPSVSREPYDYFEAAEEAAGRAVPPARSH